MKLNATRQKRYTRQQLLRQCNGLAGCALYAYDQRTGALRGIYRAKEQGIAEEGWATVCEDHGTFVISETRKLAEASHTNDFCDECRHG